MNKQNLADFIWNVADTLSGPFKPSLYLTHHRRASAACASM